MYFPDREYNYVLTLRVSVEAHDDIDARQRARVKLGELGLLDQATRDEQGVEVKLQKVFTNKPPKGMFL